MQRIRGIGVSDLRHDRRGFVGAAVVDDDHLVFDALAGRGSLPSPSTVSAIVPASL